MNCIGCKHEMEEAYRYQQLGFCIDFNYSDGHKFLIVFTEEGEIFLR
jgi:hypothetical protein